MCAAAGKNASTVERNDTFSRARAVTVWSISSTAWGSSSTMPATAPSASASDGNAHTPSTRRAGRGDSFSLIRRKKASVPSDPTSSSAGDAPGRSSRCRL